jgi:hypothetical protein
MFRAQCWAGGDVYIQRGGFFPPHRGAVFRQRPQCFWRFYWRAVTHVSSVAHSLPPRRGTVFKQRPQHNLLCLFRARLLVGGDASIKRGWFFAAAPWQGF